MPALDFLFHGLLRVRMNHGGGPLLSGLLRKYSTYQVPVSGQADLTFNFGPFQADRKGAFRLDGCYHVKENQISCDLRHKIARWRVEIKGWEGDRTEVNIDPNLPGRVVMAGETVPTMIRFQLARRGALLIHGSPVEKEGQALIFSGRSGAGKTITATQFIRAGHRYLGDDCCILNPAGVFGFAQPFNVRFTYDVEGLFGNPFTAMDRVSIFSKRLLAMATHGGINLLTSLPPERILGATVGQSGACSRFVILQNGRDFRIEDPYPIDLAVAQTITNLRFESRELSAYLLAYTHVFPRSPLATFWDNQASLLAQSLNGKRILRITVPRTYTDETFRRIAEAVSSP